MWRDEIGEIIAEETVPGLSVASARWLTAPAALRDRRLRLSLWLDDAAAFTGWFDPEPETLIPPVP
ncbi:MAG: hypothetical protein IT337_15780 [Thermomicrobiales bacterium]|nr:hypothetical protein [Thermomicrobiales bacterium]